MKDERYYFALRTPMQGRVSFSLQREIRITHSRTYSKVKDARVGAINRAYRDSEQNYEACKKEMPIFCLSKGGLISLIAQSPGNFLQVCQEYYVGYEPTSDSIEVFRAIVNSKG